MSAWYTFRCISTESWGVKFVISVKTRSLTILHISPERLRVDCETGWTEHTKSQRHDEPITRRASEMNRAHEESGARWTDYMKSRHAMNRAHRVRDTGNWVHEVQTHNEACAQSQTRRIGYTNRRETKSLRHEHHVYIQVSWKHRFPLLCAACRDNNDTIVDVIKCLSWNFDTSRKCAKIDNSFQEPWACLVWLFAKIVQQWRKSAPPQFRKRLWALPMHHC